MFNLLSNALFKYFNINAFPPKSQNNGTGCFLSKHLRLCFGVCGHESGFCVVSPGVDGLPHLLYKQ